MSAELDHIIRKWSIDTEQSSPHLLPNNRVWLARLFRVLEYKTGAEIGTASGAYAYTLAVQNRKAKLYCVDPYELYEEYNDYDETQMQTNLAVAKQRLSPLKNVEFVMKYSVDALQDFEDGSLDYVYIDANHSYDDVVFDILNWSYRVKSGGRNGRLGRLK